MLSRGYQGRLPTGPTAAVRPANWLTALTLPAAAAAILAAGLMSA
jgi:cobalt/nickel transport system permease protein